MAIMRVAFPGNLSTGAALVFGRTLRELPIADAYELDFANSRWIEPFSALIASSEISRFKRRVERPIRVLNMQHMEYAAHIGFFRSFGLDHGSQPHEVCGKTTYQPIWIISSSEIRASAERDSIAVGAVMERHADRLAHVLCQGVGGNVYDGLAYSIREIMRNVVEHSGADRLGFCAQYWPAKAKVEVAIMDWGQGIRAGLSENPKLKLDSDQHAIHLALLPGVSGKAEAVKRLRVKDDWTNSGYGLYMTSRLCRSGGSFLIGSGDSGLLLSGNEMLPLNWGLEGTAIRLQINVAALPLLGPELERFRREAHQFRCNAADGDVLTPSNASRALSKDFS